MGKPSKGVVEMIKAALTDDDEGPVFIIDEYDEPHCVRLQVYEHPRYDLTDATYYCTLEITDLTKRPVR